MRLIALLCLISALVACGSQPQQSVNYYLLYTPSPSHHSGEQDAKTKKIWLNKILLADYLKQSSLTLQVNQNQMYFSRQDVWAESLDSAIFKALLADLNSDDDRQFVGNIGLKADQKNTQLTIQFDYFHATDQSTVIASGHYWIGSAADDELTEVSFFLSLPLLQDGYSHAVLQQRELLRLLAEKIQQELVKLNS